MDSYGSCGVQVLFGLVKGRIEGLNIYMYM